MTTQRRTEVYRQGDVLIERVDEIPARAEIVPADNGRVVLAYGEVTGHAHALAARNAVASTFGLRGDAYAPARES